MTRWGRVVCRSMEENEAVRGVKLSDRIRCEGREVDRVVIRFEVDLSYPGCRNAFCTAGS